MARAHSTSLSRTLGFYFHLKAVGWAAVGLLLWFFALDTGQFGTDSPLILFAYYLILFAVPGVLLWVLGILVRFRKPMGWWIGTAYLGLVLFAKTSVGLVNMPAEVWHWLSQRLPPAYFGRATALGLFAAVAYALDVAAFVVLIAPKGRATFGLIPYPYPGPGEVTEPGGITGLGDRTSETGSQRAKE
jgi:hypothetical protein